jgi:hypothetical protein
MELLRKASRTEFRKRVHTNQAFLSMLDEIAKDTDLVRISFQT